MKRSICTVACEKAGNGPVERIGYQPLKGNNYWASHLHEIPLFYVCQSGVGKATDYI